MKKPITIKIPHCNKCKAKLEPRFTTEKEEGDNSRPEIIIVCGLCEKCKIITVTDMIQTKDLPTSIEELEEYVKKTSQNRRKEKLK